AEESAHHPKRRSALDRLDGRWTGATHRPAGAPRVVWRAGTRKLVAEPGRSDDLRLSYPYPAGATGTRTVRCGDAHTPTGVRLLALSPRYPCRACARRHRMVVAQ